MTWQASTTIDATDPQWGGDPYGKDDSTTPIANAAAAAGKTGMLTFPPGSVWAVQNVNITQSLHVEAQGATFLHIGDNQPLISAGGVKGYGATNPVWHGGILVAKQSAANPTTALAYVTRCFYGSFQFESMQCGDATGAIKYAQHGLWVQGRTGAGCYYVRFGEQPFNITGATEDAVFVDGYDPTTGETYVNACKFETIHSDHNANGFHLDGGQLNLILGGGNEGNVGVGIRMGQHVYNNEFHAVWLEANNSKGTTPASYGDQFCVDTSIPAAQKSNDFSGVGATLNTAYWRRFTNQSGFLTRYTKPYTVG